MPESGRTSHRSSVNDTAGRRFSDEDGTLWRVREVQTANRPAALYFETEVAFRRVTSYPKDWRDLPTAELEILSRGT
jgi:hypothetical protein